MNIQSEFIKNNGRGRLAVGKPPPADRPLVIPVFLPHAGCPHRCIFCNQAAITGSACLMPSESEFRNRISRFLAYSKNLRQKVYIAFYGGNFLGLPKAELTRLLLIAEEFVGAGHADGIRFSTRPDTVTDDRLDLLGAFSVSTVELGAQSMDDRVLSASGRGHSAEDTVRAVRRLKGRRYEIGLQMMIGLPGEKEAGAIETGRRIADLEPSFVRIYPTVVLSESPLARMYKQGLYRPLSLDSAINITKNLYVLFNRKDIRVVRMGLQSSTDLEDANVLAGPYHPAFGHLVLSALFLNMAQDVLKSDQTSCDTVTLRVNSRSVPKIRGIKNESLQILKNNFRYRQIHVVPDDALSTDELAVEFGSSSLTYRQQKISIKEALRDVDFCAKGDAKLRASNVARDRSRNSKITACL